MAGSYDQFCAVATALDVVGDRWTLLVVRELLARPQRYRALAHALPGIATNMLADRLRKLESAGLVEQLPDEDGRARTYRLTGAGRELRPVIDALGRFGMALVPDESAGRTFRPQWLELAVRLLVRPGAIDRDLVVRFDVRTEDGDESAQLRLDPRGGVTVDHGEPDVVLAGDPGVLLAAVRDPARARALAAAGRLTVTGDPAGRARVRAVFTGGRPPDGGGR